MSVQAANDYKRIEAAIHFLEENFQSQPDLTAVSQSVGLSEYHFHRLFTRWAGISPKRFIQFLTLNYAKEMLAASKSLLETTYETGLSSPGRLHDLFVTHEAVTPGDFKRQGAGVTIRYGFHPSPFGECLLAVTDRGICGLRFVVDGRPEQALASLQSEWPRADFLCSETATAPFAHNIFQPGNRAPIHLLLKGTNFQVRVWQALLKIPPGAAASYGTVAQMMGDPKAVRAVGTAVGRNPIAYLIPCHRVIRSNGRFGEYRWGQVRKKAIFGWEAAQQITVQ